MAWDSSRPVPWKRLVREWLVYVAIMSVVFVVLFRDDSLLGIFAGLLVSGPMYLGLGYVLAKLGYQRKSLRQARAEAHAGRDGSRSGTTSATSTPTRPRPAPTRRTGGGGESRPGGKRRR
jgi:hypothetical protein